MSFKFKYMYIFIGNIVMINDQLYNKKLNVYKPTLSHNNLAFLLTKDLRKPIMMPESQLQ